MVLGTSMSYPFLLKSFTAEHKYFSFSKKCIIKLKTQTTVIHRKILTKNFHPHFVIYLIYMLLILVYKTLWKRTLVRVNFFKAYI